LGLRGTKNFLEETGAGGEYYLKESEKRGRRGLNPLGGAGKTRCLGKKSDQGWVLGKTPMGFRNKKGVNGGRAAPRGPKTGERERPRVSLIETGRNPWSIREDARGSTGSLSHGEQNRGVCNTKTGGGGWRPEKSDSLGRRKGRKPSGGGVFKKRPNRPDSTQQVWEGGSGELRISGKTDK